MATENQENKSRRSALNERLAGRYPDLDLNDDEAVSGRISDDYDDYDRQLGEYREREESLTNMFNSDPRSAQFLSSWHNGDDPAVALMRMYGEEIKERMDDPEYQEQLAAANKEYVERVAKEKDLEEQYKQNIDGSLQELETFQNENGLSDEQVDEVMAFLQGIFQDAIIGKFSRESMEMALKAINHDTDVADAEENAEVRGRNAKIDEKLRKRNAGDGTAALNGTNGRGGQSRKPSMGALDRFGEGDDIYARGGEKRTVHAK